jgi:hypothetical protein
MQFNDLLRDEGIESKEVLVFRHCPKQPKLRKVLPWLVDQSPDIFNVYQQTQGPKVEKAMLRAKFVASFIGHEAGKAIFVGLYAVNGHRSLSFTQFWQEPANVELKTKYGMRGMTDEHSSMLSFDLVCLEFRTKWKGKLIVCWPGQEVSWWRWADRNRFVIHAILEESALVQDMPSWQRLILTWDELAALPTSWRAKLKEWRGIYLIFDVFDGKSYVGSAYGDKNLLGRWLNYAKHGDGGNKNLKSRDPTTFRFSILQRVSPDMDETKVIQLEHAWMDRLHTRTHGLNN